MFTKTTELNGIKWTVHCETGLDVIRKRQLLAKVYDPNAGEESAEFSAWYEFIDAYVQSENVSAGFVWPSYTSNIDKLLPTRDAWLALPGNVFRAWKDDISEVNTVPGADVDLLPPEDLPPKDLAIPASSPNEPQPEPL